MIRKGIVCSALAVLALVAFAPAAFAAEAEGDAGRG
jgi:hypothetical protein